ncbi:hypothetical protein PFISCL1PPCAC_14771, partial [Pristionchus fissidentatus]
FISIGLFYISSMADIRFIQRSFPHSNEPIPTDSNTRSGFNVTGSDSNFSSVSSAFSDSSVASSGKSMDARVRQEVHNAVAKNDPELVRQLLCGYSKLREVKEQRKTQGKKIGGLSKSQLNFVAILMASCALATYAVALMNRETFCKKLD